MSIPIRIEGCGQSHADLYQLAMHEERCEGKPLYERPTSFRFTLNASVEAGAPPAVIIVNRGSGKPPEGWKAGKDTIQESLPLLGCQIFAHYAAWSGFAGGPGVIHSCYDCSTRYLPSPSVDDSFLETVDSRRKALYRAFKFTQAIVGDIEAANQAGVTRMVDPVRPRTHP
jgi:hypothetical protein